MVLKMLSQLIRGTYLQCVKQAEEEEQSGHLTEGQGSYSGASVICWFTVTFTYNLESPIKIAEWFPGSENATTCCFLVLYRAKNSTIHLENKTK